MAGITPWLWFASDAEDAAAFYAGILPDSRIERVSRLSGDADGMKIVEMTLAGRRFTAMGGGAPAGFSVALSLGVACADQPELDRIWSALLDGGEAQRCGWLRDRHGLSWQVVPARLAEIMATAAPDQAARVMRAMMGMVKLDIAGLEAALTA